MSEELRAALGKIANSGRASHPILDAFQMSEIAAAALRASTDAAAVGIKYDDTAQDAVMRLLETGKATVNADGYLVAHPPVADAAVAGEGVMPSEIAEAIRATEYKYFGDYEMSDDQREAVDVLVRFAQQYYSPPIPRPAPCEPVDLREALAMAQEVRDLLLERIQGSPARSAAHNARVRADSLIQLLSSMTPALSTLTPDTIGSHYGNGGRFDPVDDGLREDQRKRRIALIERISTFADGLSLKPLPGAEGDVAYDLLRQAAAQMSSDNLALSTLTRTDEASTDGKGE